MQQATVLLVMFAVPSNSVCTVGSGCVTKPEADAPQSRGMESRKAKEKGQSTTSVVGGTGGANGYMETFL